jgi:lipopolysaccharide transport system permease protein
LLLMMLTIGVGALLAALTVAYRDFRYVVPFLVQTLMFLSPVVYASESILGPAVPDWLAPLYFLNPLAGVIEGFRWALFGRPELPLELVLVTGAGVALLLVASAWYFRRMERLFADLA